MATTTLPSEQSSSFPRPIDALERARYFSELAAWIEDARMTLGRIEDARSLHKDLDATMAAHGLVAPRDWVECESYALQGLYALQREAMSEAGRALASTSN